MYAAINFSQKSIQITIKDKQGKLVKESKMDKNKYLLLEYLKDANVQVVMESGYNYHIPYDLSKNNKYKVKVAQPFMVKAITYAKVKTNKVESRMVADLDRTGMIPEAYIPNEKIRDVRDRVRRKQSFVHERIMYKNKVNTELTKRGIGTKASPSTQPVQKRLRDLKIEAVNDSLYTVSLLDGKTMQIDMCVQKKALSNKYTKLLISIPGILHYSALALSSEITDINMFPNHEHLCSYARLGPKIYQSGKKLQLCGASKRRVRCSDG